MNMNQPHCQSFKMTSTVKLNKDGIPIPFKSIIVNDKLTINESDMKIIDVDEKFEDGQYIYTVYFILDLKPSPVKNPKEEIIVFPADNMFGHFLEDEDDSEGQ